MASKKLQDAFAFADRRNFMPDGTKDKAYLDSALPIGHGQTISQPYTVRLMLEWLEPQEGDRVLDVGSGSGWTTALLSRLVGERGHVYAVERIPELEEFGRQNCERIGVSNAVFFQAHEDTYGLPEHAPYDRILVSAAAKSIPEDLKEQLKTGGKMVIPVGGDILEMTKNTDGSWRTEPHSGFVFVPLV